MFCVVIEHVASACSWLAADRTPPAFLHFFAFLMLRRQLFFTVLLFWHLRHEVDATLWMGVGLGGAC